MADRHPLGCDPESFRTLRDPDVFAQQRIPRRAGPPQQRPLRTFVLPASQPQNRLPRHEQSAVGVRQREQPYDSYIPVTPYRRPRYEQYVSVGRTGGAHPPLDVPGINEVIDDICRTAKQRPRLYPPHRSFQEKIDELSNLFISHVQSERALILRHRWNELKRRKPLVALSKKKRYRADKDDDKSDPGFSFGEGGHSRSVSVQGLRPPSKRVKYNANGYKEPAESLSLRVQLPRKSKVNRASLAEEDTDESSSEGSRFYSPPRKKSSVSFPPVVKHSFVPASPRVAASNPELWHQRKDNGQEKNELADTAFEPDESKKPQPVLCPRPFVFERSLIADHTSLTPFAIRDDDGLATEITRSNVLHSKKAPTSSPLNKNSIDDAKYTKCAYYCGVPLLNRRLTKRDSIVIMDSALPRISTLGAEGKKEAPLQKCNLLYIEAVCIEDLRSKTILDQKVRHKWEPGSALRHAKELFERNRPAPETAPVKSSHLPDMSKQANGKLFAEASQKKLSSTDFDMLSRKVQTLAETKRPRSQLLPAPALRGPTCGIKRNPEYAWKSGNKVTEGKTPYRTITSRVPPELRDYWHRSSDGPFNGYAAPHYTYTNGLVQESTGTFLNQAYVEQASYDPRNDGLRVTGEQTQGASTVPPTASRNLQPRLNNVLPQGFVPTPQNQEIAFSARKGALVPRHTHRPPPSLPGLHSDITQSGHPFQVPEFSQLSPEIQKHYEAQYRRQFLAEMQRKGAGS